MTRPHATALAVLGAGCLAFTGSVTADEPQDSGPREPELRPLHVEGERYETPRAGEGFRTNVLGQEVEVPPRNRRSVSALALGLTASAPGADGNEVLPFGSLFFWRHPDENNVFRAVVAGVFNDVFLAKSTDSAGPFELIGTFENFTVPVSRTELADGFQLDRQELLEGSVRPGVGLGWRRPVPPGYQDNMLSFGLTAEPGWLYFDDDEDTAPSFVVPEDTLETRIRLRSRWDALERNLLELPHQGAAAGTDLLWGWREDWRDWGPGGRERATEGRDWLLFTGYAVGATEVPWADSSRHRLLGSVHFGVGDDVDRFSAQRVGGGPQGEEYLALARPVLPGAVINEFFPDHYVVAIAEYRFEPIFFTYLSVRSSVAWLDRDHLAADGSIRRENDVLGSIGGRLTTGFIGDLRIVLDYNYSPDIVRRGEHGGHEIVLQISREIF